MKLVDWSLACTFRSRLLTLTSSMGNACQPRKSFAEMLLLILAWPNNSHTSATETPPTDPYSHILIKGRPPKKAHNIIGEKGPLSRHTTPTHIDKLVVPVRKTGSGHPSPTDFRHNWLRIIEFSKGLISQAILGCK